MQENVRIHPTAEVSPQAEIGAESMIWHQAQVREGAHLGCNCIVGKGAYIDFDVQIGDNVKVQNYVAIYHGATIEDGVFLGPYVCLTNDKLPRAVNPDGSLKGADDWVVGPILVREGAAIGARAVVLPGVGGHARRALLWRGVGKPGGVGGICLPLGSAAGLDGEGETRGRGGGETRGRGDSGVAVPEVWDGG
jgi:acetyltransferase-like isoleucine patch superfamily enzyme